MAYADPPYPGKAWMYRGEPTYAGEVDHAALIASLKAFDGWALSTSARALRHVLPWHRHRGPGLARGGPRCSRRRLCSSSGRRFVFAAVAARAATRRSSTP
jgi:hypothetical protein